MQGHVGISDIKVIFRVGQGLAATKTAQDFFGTSLELKAHLCQRLGTHARRVTPFRSLNYEIALKISLESLALNLK